MDETNGKLLAYLKKTIGKFSKFDADLAEQLSYIFDIYGEIGYIKNRLSTLE